MHWQIFENIEGRNPIGARQAVRRLMKRTLEDSRKALAKLE
jgi:DNA-binding FadR family transcriptional regulator